MSRLGAVKRSGLVLSAQAVLSGVIDGAKRMSGLVLSAQAVLSGEMGGATWAALGGM